MSHEMTSPTTLQPIENCAPGIHWLHFRINFGYNIFVVRNDSPILGFCFYFISNTIATVITLDISKQWSCHTLEFKNNDFITINNENDYQLVMLGIFFFINLCVFCAHFVCYSKTCSANVRKHCICKILPKRYYQMDPQIFCVLS